MSSAGDAKFRLRNGRTVHTVMARSRNASAKVIQGEATRSRILQAAEGLFATFSYDGTSLRRIAAEAGYELSLVLYHFRSKELLYQAVFERGLESILRERHKHVEAMMEGDADISVEGVLLAFSKPWLELFDRDEDNTAIVFARSLFEHSDHQRALIEEHVDPEARFFIAALQKAAPNAPPDEIHRYYHMFVGQLVYSILERGRIARISGKNVSDVRGSLEFTAKIIADRLKGSGVRR